MPRTSFTQRQSSRPHRKAEMIQSREHLIHVLTEAAEIEHNLLCSYLYAAFSMKRPGEPGLIEPQAKAVERWRKTVLKVSLEEMAHLATPAHGCGEAETVC